MLGTIEVHDKRKAADVDSGAQEVDATGDDGERADATSNVSQPAGDPAPTMAEHPAAKPKSAKPALKTPTFNKPVQLASPQDKVATPIQRGTGAMAAVTSRVPVHEAENLLDAQDLADPRVMQPRAAPAGQGGQTSPQNIPCGCQARAGGNIHAGIA